LLSVARPLSLCRSRQRRPRPFHVKFLNFNAYSRKPITKRLAKEGPMPKFIYHGSNNGTLKIVHAVHAHGWHGTYQDDTPHVMRILELMYSIRHPSAPPYTARSLHEVHPQLAHTNLSYSTFHPPLCIVKTNYCRPLPSHPRYSFPATLRLALSPSISFCVRPTMHWHNWSRQLGTAIAQFLIFTLVSIRMSYASRAPTINLQDSIT
jgi:hypothetical protein